MLTDYSLFRDIIFNAFLGNTYRFEDIQYKLKPMLLKKYDFLRAIDNPANEFERLVKKLPRDFKRIAKSEMYRREGGWIEKGLKNHELRLVQTSKAEFIVPWLGTDEIGIDTKSYDNKWTIISIGAFIDPEASYAYCEKHLSLPKAVDPSEFKWAKLNEPHRLNLLKSLGFFLPLSCYAILAIRTNALIKPVEKHSDIFIKLVEGCFSGYEAFKGVERIALREKFFNMVNKVPIHCDDDFSPLTPDKIVRFLVKTLSNGKDFTPLHVEKKSEESIPIQLADLICGALHTHIVNGTWNSISLRPIEFNNRLKGRNQGKIAKAYLWLSS